MSFTELLAWLREPIVVSTGQVFGNACLLLGLVWWGGTVWLWWRSERRAHEVTRARLAMVVHHQDELAGEKQALSRALFLARQELALERSRRASTPPPRPPPPPRPRH